MKNEMHAPHGSSIGTMNANSMALLCYVAAIPLGWIPVLRYVAWLAPLALFLLEKQSKFVKFHAMQAFLLQVVSAVLSFLVSVVLGGILGVGSLSAATYYAAAGLAGMIGLLTTVISLIILVFAIIAMVGAYQYKETHIPVLGGIAQRIVQR